jgi:DMSO/TMAO reductase YedYZ molybdopterin-dependent catalytic subunit
MHRRGSFVRFTNTALLTLVGLLTLTGVYGLVWPLPQWMFETHRAAGWALIALVPWKAAISLRSLRRGMDRRFDRSVVVIVSLILAAATLLVLGLGLMWAWQLGPQLVWLGAYADTLISWHWMLALALLPFFALHVWRRWPRPRRADLVSRRSALKLLGLGAAGLTGWWAAESLSGLRADPGAPRRFTGSREQGSFAGNAFPITHLSGEGQIRLDPLAWRLALGGRVERPLALSYDDLLSLPAADKIATLDCTTGWYSTQVWRGVPLSDVINLARPPRSVAAIQLKAASGYVSYFTWEEAREILLASHVGGEVLDHWHGFPLRAVVPSRRGWHWVKWLTEIDVVGGA